MRRLIKAETMIGSTLLLFLCWLGVQATISSSAIASLQTKQVANDRVHEMVYDISSFIPRVEQKLITIEKGIAANTIINTKLAGVQKHSNAKLYCLYAYPPAVEGKVDIHELKRDKCIQNFIEDGS